MNLPLTPAEAEALAVVLYRVGGTDEPGHPRHALTRGVMSKLSKRGYGGDALATQFEVDGAVYIEHRKYLTSTRSPRADQPRRRS